MKRGSVAQAIIRLAETGWGRLIFFLFVLGTWEWSIWAFAIPKTILPPPSSIWNSLILGFMTPLGASHGYYIHIGVTLSETLGGFILGGALGIFLGAILAEVPILRSLFHPYILAFQSLPKVAVAPLLVVWFGFGITSKIVISALLVFFPLMVNTMTGMAATDPRMLKLFRSLRANRWQTFRMVRLPTSLPFIFAGLEVGIVYAVIGAIVGEFIGSYRGLGLLMTMRNATMDMPGVFAIFVLLSLTGIGLHQILIWIRRKTIFWQPQADEQRTIGL